MSPLNGRRGRLITKNTHCKSHSERSKRASGTSADSILLKIKFSHIDSHILTSTRSLYLNLTLIENAWIKHKTHVSGVERLDLNPCKYDFYRDNSLLAYKMIENKWVLDQKPYTGKFIPHPTNIMGFLIFFRRHINDIIVHYIRPSSKPVVLSLSLCIFK